MDAGCLTKVLAEQRAMFCEPGKLLASGLPAFTIKITITVVKAENH